MMLPVLMMTLMTSVPQVSQEFSAQILDEKEKIVGHWDYHSYIYQGHEIVLPRESKTKLFYVFDGEGSSELQWSNADDHSFCDRKGVYTYDGKNLQDQVTWVNPENSPSCASDADMQIGRVAVSAARVNGDRLEVDIPVSEEIITYIWYRSK